MKSTLLKIRSTCCVLLVILLASVTQTGCSHVSPASAAMRRLYQPPVLRLPLGQPVQTLDGLYCPQTPEIWHSDARYVELEARYIDTLAALAVRRP
jgi:hypothetical protein